MEKNGNRLLDNLITIIAIFILYSIVNFLSKQYPKVSMVLRTISLVALWSVVSITLFITINVAEMFGQIPIMLKLLVIIILILPIILLKGYIGHTIRILYFFINKNKILETGQIEKGIIQEIKAYSFESHRVKHAAYLIVDFNGEKIKSLPFRYNQGGNVVRTTYKTVYRDGKFNKEKIEEDLGCMPQLYNVGDEIDVIIYNNKKYVKLKEYEI